VSAHPKTIPSGDAGALGRSRAGVSFRRKMFSNQGMAALEEIDEAKDFFQSLGEDCRGKGRKSIAWNQRFSCAVRRSSSD